MPACDLLLLGAKEKNMAGFSSVGGTVGYLEETEIWQSAPPSLRKRVCRILAGKATLAERVDSNGGYPSGEKGRGFRGKIHNMIEKWQEPHPSRQPKRLPVPDLGPKKKKRCGKRSRNRTERFGITEMRKQVNWMQFGLVEESSLGDGHGEGYVMLIKKRRVSVGQSTISLKLQRNLRTEIIMQLTYGLTSSLAFTPVQGIELSNPQAVQLIDGTTQTSYFSETGTFPKFKP